LIRYVLYKERNMLLTELQLSRRRGLVFPQPERMKKVGRSMGAIRQVLGERKRDKIAAFQRERQIQQQDGADGQPAVQFHE
jgi:large subunit ribosomal protein L47